MSQRKKKANWRRQQVVEEEEEEEIHESFNWSELCPDLLRSVFKRLSFTSLNRAKSVCSSWHTASKGCVPNQNNIPWLILFEEANNNKNSSCVLFIPEDKDKVYTSRYLGVDFAQSRCLTTCGSWLLMSNSFRHLYMLNPLTGERIDLLDTQYPRAFLEYEKACFSIDSKTKDYLVIWGTEQSTMFIKKGDNEWRAFPLFRWHKDFVYIHKDQKVYFYHPNYSVEIWDLSGDNPSKYGSLDSFCFNHYEFSSWTNEELYWENLFHFRTRIAITVSGDVLVVACIMLRCKTWHFRIYKTNHVTREWVKIDSLGDEALIYDMGTTVFAKDIPGIKKNSVYFSGIDHGRNNPDHIFVYDLVTQKMELLPQCVFSSIHFSNARWFFPC